MRLEKFDLKPDTLLAGKYRVQQLLGIGWEGEVYKVLECGTGIERAAKLFFPHRNARNTTARRYAVKLHKLRHCHVLIQYYTQEFIEVKAHRVSMLLSEYVEGELLSTLVANRRGRVLPTFEALHMLHALASGIAEVHLADEYHGDLHTDNIIVQRFGLGFHVKVIDFYYWKTPRRENIQHDVCDLVRILYDIVGGARTYRRQPPEIKNICCGLKRSLIAKKFRNAAHLRDHLETIDWS